MQGLYHQQEGRSFVFLGLGSDALDNETPKPPSNWVLVGYNFTYFDKDS